MMSAVQKQAWFNLIVVAVAAVTIISLYPWLGARAIGGAGILGLCGLGALFHWRHGRRVVIDERDELINRRAMVWAYGVVWVVFIIAVLIAPRLFGDSVPIAVVQNSVWVAFMILLATQSIVALVQYRLGAPDAE